MQAVVQHAYGAVDDVLLLQDLDEPTPGPHEVLVRVHAASVNHADWFVATGRPYLMRAALGLGPATGPDPRAGPGRPGRGGW